MKKILVVFSLVSLLFSSCIQNNKNKTEDVMQIVSNGHSTGFKSGYSQVNGIKMYFEIHGENGGTLVLIHGGGSTIGTTFGRILPLLARDHKVIAVELQAHGHTSDRDSPESFEQDADDVAALLQNLGISRASFFGFSNGGNDAIQIAIRHPQLIEKLVLASTFYKREGLIPGFFDGMKNATIDAMPQVLKDAFLQINPDTRKLLTMFNKDKERMLRFKDWEDETISSISVPTLIISGDQDVILPEHALAMAKLIKNSRVMILPSHHGTYIGAGEGGSVDDKLIEVTVEVILEFLNQKDHPDPSL